MITPLPGWQVDPNNPGWVIRADATQTPSTQGINTQSTGVGAPQASPQLQSIGTPGPGMFSPQGPMQFSQLMQIAMDRINSNNKMGQERQLLIKHLYDKPLSSDEISRLSPETQKAVAIGDRSNMEMQLRLINDSISGRQNTLTQSVQFLTDGYTKSLENVDKQRKEATDSVIKFAQQYGARAPEVLKHLYGPQYLEQLKSMGIDIGALTKIPTVGEEKITAQYGGGTLGPVLQSNELKGLLEIYHKTGVIPPMGLSAGTMRKAFYAAIGAGGPEFVSEAIANKASIAGASTALRTQRNQYAALETSLGTLDKQLGLLDTYSTKVDRSGSPLINKYLLYAKGEIAGDADTKAFENIVTTASNEFAKILSGSSASIAGVTVSSAAEAKNLINAQATPEQLTEVMKVMGQEAQFRLNSQKESIQTITQDIRDVGKDSTSGTASVSLKDPNTGEIRTFDNLSAADLQDALNQGYIQQ